MYGKLLHTYLESGQESITMPILEQQALPMRKLLSMAREIHEGEETLAANNISQAEIRSLLGNAARSDEPLPSKTSRKVGQRNPVRDMVDNHETAKA